MNLGRTALQDLRDSFLTSQRILDRFNVPKTTPPGTTIRRALIVSGSTDSAGFPRSPRLLPATVKSDQVDYYQSCARVFLPSLQSVSRGRAVSSHLSITKEGASRKVAWTLRSCSVVHFENFSSPSTRSNAGQAMLFPTSPTKLGSDRGAIGSAYPAIMLNHLSRPR